MPANYPFGGGGRVSFWVAEQTQVIEHGAASPPASRKELCVPIPPWEPTSLLPALFMSLEMQEQSKYSHCALSCEVSKKRINSFGFRWWEFVFFNGKSFFFF